MGDLLGTHPGRVLSSMHAEFHPGRKVGWKSNNEDVAALAVLS